MINLEARWKSLCARHCTDASLVDRRWNELKDAYTAPKRFYHNLEHISFMLEQMIAFEAEIENPEAFEMAIFIHDHVYKVQRNDNEEQSAKLAEQLMNELGFPKHSIELTVQHILATKSHEASENTDTNLLLDIDMAIIGQNWEAYNDYCKRIRMEYAMYPDILYKPGRRKVLEHFLEMPNLFKNEAFIQRYQQSARLNIQRELSQL